MKYTTDGKYSVFSGKIEIARAYVGPELRILQGMPRMETINKIAQDCPEFLEANNWDVNKVPRLFSA